MPELEIQSDFGKLSGFCKRLIFISKYSTISFTFSYIGTKEEPRTVKPMDFTPEV